MHYLVIGENMAKNPTNKLVAKWKRDKAFADILSVDNIEDEFISTNCGPVNVLFSGKAIRLAKRL